MVVATTHEVDLLRRHLEELNARMEDIRQQSANADMNTAVTGLAEAVRTMGQSVTRPRPEAGNQNRMCPAKTSMIGTLRSMDTLVLLILHIRPC